MMLLYNPMVINFQIKFWKGGRVLAREINLTVNEWS